MAEPKPVEQLLPKIIAAQKKAKSETGFFLTGKELRAKFGVSTSWQRERIPAEWRNFQTVVSVKRREAEMFQILLGIQKKHAKGGGLPYNVRELTDITGFSRSWVTRHYRRLPPNLRLGSPLSLRRFGTDLPDDIKQAATEVEAALSVMKPSVNEPPKGVMNELLVQMVLKAVEQGRLSCSHDRALGHRLVWSCGEPLEVKPHG